MSGAGTAMRSFLYVYAMLDCNLEWSLSLSTHACIGWELACQGDVSAHTTAFWILDSSAVWPDNMSELQGCPRFSHLTLTGGAIGSGPPLAVGAAIACPDRPVINVQVFTRPSHV